MIKLRKYNTFVDPRDEQEYKVVKIGNQIWMAENLRFRMDSSIAYNHIEKNVAKYGLLYSRSCCNHIAPNGWHLPSMAEFRQLQKFAEENSNVRSVDSLLSTEWQKSHNKGTDEFGFSALPAGYSCAQGICHGLEKYTAFWTTDGTDVLGEFYDIGPFNYDELGDSFVGYVSVRLIKD